MNNNFTPFPNLSIDNSIQHRHAKQRVEFVESLLETALSCVCAGVPMSDVFVQVWDEWKDYTMTTRGRIGFGSQVPLVGYKSTVYRL